MIINHTATENNWNQPEIMRNAQTLILGSFNPFNPNGNNADYYYGRASNYLWKAIANIANLDQNIFQGNTQLKLDFMFEHKFCFLDVIDSIEVTNVHDNDEQIGQFVDQRIYIEFSDKVLFTTDTNFGEVPIHVTRNYNESVFNLLDQGNIRKIIHTMGNRTIDTDFNTNPLENNLGQHGFHGYINMINDYGNVDFIPQSYSPSGRAVRTGGPNYLSDLQNWLNESLNIN